MTAQIPIQRTRDQILPYDWANIAVKQRDRSGRHTLGVRHYTFERSTGDLYVLDTAAGLRGKHVQLLVGTPIFTAGLLTIHFIKIPLDAVLSVAQAVTQLIKTFHAKGPIGAIGTFFLIFPARITLATGENLWLVVRDPFYCLGIMLSALLGIVSPLEGRKWVSHLEASWHQGATFQDDLRYLHRGERDPRPEKIMQELLDGKVFHLAYCMQKRGNINDIAAGKPQHEIIDETEDAEFL